MSKHSYIRRKKASTLQADFRTRTELAYWRQLETHNSLKGTRLFFAALGGSVRSIPVSVRESLDVSDWLEARSSRTTPLYYVVRNKHTGLVPEDIFQSLTKDDLFRRYPRGQSLIRIMTVENKLDLLHIDVVRSITPEEWVNRIFPAPGTTTRYLELAKGRFSPFRLAIWKDREAELKRMWDMIDPAYKNQALEKHYKDLVEKLLLVKAKKNQKRHNIRL